MMAALTKTQIRINQLLNQDNNDDASFDAYYRECLEFISQHLNAFYAKYADENGLSLKQTQQRVNSWDLAEWKQAISSIDMSEWSQDAKQRAKLYGVQAGFNKTAMLGAIIGLGVVAMHSKYQNNVTQRVNKDAKSELDHVAAPKKVRKQLKTIINDDDTTAMWSDSLWLKSDEFTHDVQRLVNQHLRHGMKFTDLSELLQAHDNPAQFKPNKSLADRLAQSKSNAKRILMTESQRTIYRVDTATYRQQGVKYVNWVNEPRSCDNCQGLADMSPYLIDDCPKIPDDSHPYCRCHIEPAKDFEVVQATGLSDLDNHSDWPNLMSDNAFINLEKQQTPLTQKQHDILWDKRTGYIQTTTSSSINDVVRGNTKGWIPDEYRQTIDVLKSAIAHRTLRKAVRAQRFMDRDYIDALQAKLKAKTVSELIKKINSQKPELIESCFTSVSLSKKNVFTNRPIKVNYLLPKGTHALVTDNFTESEAILAPNVKYDIVRAFIDSDNKLELFLKPKE